MFSLAALVLLLSSHRTASFFYLKNVTWQEANETCDLATPPITDWKNVALELPNIPDEYRRTALWTGYYQPDIVIENIGCLSAANYTSTISITETPPIGDIGCCFSVCKAAATIGIQRKGITLYCYCLTNDESLHEDSVNHCTLIQENRQKTNYGGKEDQIALYRKAENRLVSENEDKNARCVAYDIEEREYVYKHCEDKIGVFCQNYDDCKEPMSGLSWEEGADHCIDKSSVLPNEITSGLLDSLSNDSNVSHIWTRLQGKYTIIWKKPAITPVDLFVCLNQIGDDSNRAYTVDTICKMRSNAICNDPLPETTASDSSIPPSPTPTTETNYSAPLTQNNKATVPDSSIPPSPTPIMGTNYSAPLIQNNKGQPNLYTYIGISGGIVFLIVVVVVVVLLVRRKANGTSKKDRIASVSVRETKPDSSMEDAGNGARTDDGEHFYDETEFNHQNSTVTKDHITGKTALGHFYHTIEVHHRINDENAGEGKSCFVNEATNRTSGTYDVTNPTNCVKSNTYRQNYDVTNRVYDATNETYDVANRIPKATGVETNVYNRIGDLGNATLESVYDVSGQQRFVTPVHENLYNTTSAVTEDGDNLYDSGTPAKTALFQTDNVYSTSKKMNREID